MSQLVGVPTPVDGTQLIGEMVGSGYRTPPALVRRGDGQVLQLTPLLYLVLKAADGRRTPEEIAAVVGQAMQRHVTGDDITTLVDGHLRPLGLLMAADGSAPGLKRSNPLVGLKPRIAVTSPEATRRITDPFRILFRTPVVVLVVAGFVLVTGWVFFERGLAPAAYDAFERPHLLLLVFVVSILSGGLHEFGHAAATRYGGGQPGAMGAGLYLVWPAFYTDVTDSYRLGRADRIRTDLGGLYFNAIVVCITFVWWQSTGWEALLLLVATQVLQMVQQLLPLLRFDGYHVLADLAGVPDLYARIKPTLAGLLPHKWRSPENKVLKPGARLVITFWVLVTVPMMALMLYAVVAAVPRLLGSAGSAVSENFAATRGSFGSGDVLTGLGNTLALLGVILPVVATALILGRIGLRSATRLTTWSKGSAPRRVVAVLVAATSISLLAWFWYPDPGTYDPIEPDDGGLVAQLLPGSQEPTGPEVVPVAARSAVGSAAESRLSGDRPLSATFEEGSTLPTEDEPQLALVLVPSDGEPAPTGTPTDGSGTEAPDGTWVFPFDKPLPPQEGDNQALAVNTTDGGVSYDVAFAMVWADGSEDVLNVNEARAYASCSNCVTVAVAFQVVLIMDDAQVIVPQNIATAVNYECYRCITAAIANQLVLSIPGEPGEEDLRSLAEVWGRLTAFAQNITSYNLSEVAAALEGFKAEIIEILLDAPPLADSAATASAAPSAEPSASGSPSTAPSSSPTAGSSPSGGTTTTSPSPTPAPSTSSAPAPAPSPTPTAGSGDTSSGTTADTSGTSTTTSGGTADAPLTAGTTAP